MDESPLVLFIAGVLIGFVLGYVFSDVLRGKQAQGVVFERDEHGRIIAIHGYR